MDGVGATEDVSTLALRLMPRPIESLEQFRRSLRPFIDDPKRWFFMVLLGFVWVS